VSRDWGSSVRDVRGRPTRGDRARQVSCESRICPKWLSAVHLEREHKLTADAMTRMMAYTRGEYASDLLKGPSDPEATPRIVKKVTEMTGLEEEFVLRFGGRLEIGAYLQEVFREHGRLGSIYDANVMSSIL
jgi:carboxypeptidase C (cathepsin A)